MASNDSSEYVEDLTGHLPISVGEVQDFTDPSLHDDFTKKLVNMRNTKFLTDVELSSGHVEIQCHKLVLSITSPYLQQMFESAQLEGTTLNSIKLCDVRPEVLESIVEFLYTTRIKITVDNVKALAKASKLLELTNLKSACDLFISGKVQAANCLGLFSFSKRHTLPLTTKKALEIMMLRPNEVLQSSLDTEFKGLSVANFEFWITNDDLQVETEGVVFQLVVKWLEVNEGKWKTVPERVLKHVRLAQCDPAYLIKVIDKHPLFQTTMCKEMVQEAQRCMLVPEMKESMKLTNPKPRKYCKPHIIILGGGTGKELNDKCWYLKNDSTWGTLTTVPRDLGRNPYHMAACHVGNSFVVSGGSADKNTVEANSSSTWLFDILSRNWKQLPPMNKARASHGMVCVGGSVLVIGGNGVHNTTLASVEKLQSVKSQQWEEVPPMKHAVIQCKSFNINSKIYVLSSIHRKTQMYDLEKNCWHVMADVPTSSRSAAGAVARGDDIYLVGGFDNQCFCYHTKQDMWVKLMSHINVHIFPFVAEVQGQILLGAGWSDWVKDKCAYDFEEYNPSTDKWSTSKLQFPVGIGAGCALKANI